MQKYLFRSVIEGLMEGPDEATVRESVAAQVSMTTNLARGATSVSVEVFPVVELEESEQPPETPVLAFEAQVGKVAP